MARPTNSDDVIDSRDVIAAIEEIAQELEDLDSESSTYFSDKEELTEEFNALKALADAGESADDWEYGETLVRDSYFEDYAREMVEDCGYFTQQTGPYSSAKSVDFSQWPYRCIDWEQVASELQTDYFDVEFDGVTYWIR